MWRKNSFRRSNKRKQTKERKKEKIAKKIDAQLIVVRKKYKEHYYKNHFSKTEPSKTKSNNFSFTEENVETINNELDYSNLSETRKKKEENCRKIKKKTVLIVGDSKLNGIEESKLTKQDTYVFSPFREEKLIIWKKILMIYYMKNYKR